MTEKLEDGFYWVRVGQVWMTARLTKRVYGYRVRTTDYGRSLSLGDLDEIDPRPIKRVAT